MKAKFINESKKHPMRYIDLDPELQAEYGIPDWALYWNGVNIPEAAVYVDNKLDVGDVVANDVDGEPVLVIYKDEFGTFATRAINTEQDEL